MGRVLFGESKGGSRSKPATPPRPARPDPMGHGWATTLLAGALLMCVLGFIDLIDGFMTAPWARPDSLPLVARVAVLRQTVAVVGIALAAVGAAARSDAVVDRWLILGCLVLLLINLGGMGLLATRPPALVDVDTLWSFLLPLVRGLATSALLTWIVSGAVARGRLRRSGMRATTDGGTD